MELRVLRYFLAVADHGSITAAAARVHVAQPSLSRQLRGLEHELGVELFVRDGRSLRLGPAGRRFLPIARDLVARADMASATMTALAQGLNVSLAVAAHTTTIADVIAPFVASRGRSMATPRFVAASADASYEALSRAEVDVAISTVPPPAGVASTEIAAFPIWAQVPATHPWAGLEEVALDMLLRRPLILLDDTFGTRRAFDAEVARAGGAYELAAVVSMPEIAQALASAGDGVAVLTDEPAYGLHAVAIAGNDGPLHITLRASWNPTSYAVDAIRDFAQALSVFCAAPADNRLPGS
ncbi:MAG TPA: LysR family transcriptional regulator [Gaiellaceae bacterium]|nr:LysR family transcriptional regulator [Gaiellaceae bacterium]